MLNIEEYKDALEGVAEQNMPFALVNNTPVVCSNYLCQYCDFYSEDNTKCDVKRYHWLAQESIRPQQDENLDSLSELLSELHRNKERKNDC